MLKVKNDFDIAPHKFYLYTDSGKVFERYYLPIKKGNNVIVLNPVGFSKSNTSDKIVRLAWRIYTSKMTTQGTIGLEGVYKTENNLQLQNVFLDNKFHFEEKKARGNIY